MVIYAPLFLTPVTDFSNLLITRHSQYDYKGLCAQLEMKFMDCLEAYGSRKAATKCAAVLYDMHECNNHGIKRLRLNEIYKENMKQYREGKIKAPFEEHPPLDSFLYL